MRCQFLFNFYYIIFVKSIDIMIIVVIISPNWANFIFSSWKDIIYDKINYELLNNGKEMLLSIKNW